MREVLHRGNLYPSDGERVREWGFLAAVLLVFKKDVQVLKLPGS